MKLFQQIQELQPTLQGWCSVQKAQTLAAAILAMRPQIVLEIGIFGGSSFIPMALAVKEIGRGVVWGIDPWQATDSVQGQVNEADQKYWGEQGKHDFVYNDFMSKLVALELKPFTNIQRVRSDDAFIPTGIQLLHIDGNHSDQAVKDVENYAPKCVTGALCFCDDEHWAGGGVLRALAKLKSMGWKELYRLDTGVMLQKI